MHLQVKRVQLFTYLFRYIIAQQVFGAATGDCAKFLFRIVSHLFFLFCSILFSYFSLNIFLNLFCFILFYFHQLSNLILCFCYFLAFCFRCALVLILALRSSTNLSAIERTGAIERSAWSARAQIVQRLPEQQY